MTPAVANTRRELLVEERPAPTWPHTLQVTVSHREVREGHRPTWHIVDEQTFPTWDTALASLHA